MTKKKFKRIALFGSSGMVGQNLIELSPDNIDLICPSSKEVDLTQKHLVKEYISDQKPELIINCAGKVGGIQANMAEPYDFFLQNLPKKRTNSNQSEFSLFHSQHLWRT